MHIGKIEIYIFAVTYRPCSLIEYKYKNFIDLTYKTSEKTFYSIVPLRYFWSNFVTQELKFTKEIYWNIPISVTIVSMQIYFLKLFSNTRNIATDWIESRVWNWNFSHDVKELIRTGSNALGPVIELIFLRSSCHWY